MNSIIIIAGILVVSAIVALTLWIFHDDAVYHRNPFYTIRSIDKDDLDG